MSEQILDKINHLFNEEKWTRATISNYTIKNFQDLDILFDEIVEAAVQKEIKELCEQHLEHSKNSIIALYLFGILSLKRQLIDDTHLIQLITIFADNHKWNIVEYLCKRILDFGENKTALKTLAECYANENRDKEKIQIWERLIKIDYNEAEIVRKLGDLKEQEGEKEEALKYYKKALHRFINKKLFNHIRDIWLKILEYNQEDIEFYFLIEKRVARNISSEKSIILLKDLYPGIKATESWNTCLAILKNILEYDQKDSWARDEIIDCYKSKYKDHSHLDEYIRLSNLNQSWRNVLEAISDFEKHISFDKGNFVYHKTWGVGIIRDISNGEIKIDFVKKRNHEMSLKMAITALTGLDKNHIWVQKSILSKEKLNRKIKDDTNSALKMIIKSFDNQADLKRIKQELVPSILTPGEWNTWSTEARHVLKTDSAFGNLPDKADCYVVRDKPMSYEERIYNQFKAEKDFFNKIGSLREFLDNAEPDSDFFLDMFQYFTSFLKSQGTNVYVLCSFLIVNKLVDNYSFLNPGMTFTFKDFLLDVEDLEKLFKEIDDAELKKEFLLLARKELENWQEIYLTLFPHYLNKFVLEDLINNGYREEVQKKVLEIVDRYREDREAFFWISKNFMEIPGLEKLNIKYEKILINLIHLLEMTYRDINNKRDVSGNRRINKNIQNYLFKEVRIENYLLSQNEDTIIRIFSLLQDVRDLDPGIVHSLKLKILEKFPKINLAAKILAPEIAAASKNFFTTQKSYTDKQRELKYILDVDIPNNSKEIGKAIELGDLRENAEYKAGKERQETLNIAVGKLKDELDRARIFEIAAQDLNRAGFGMEVVLTNKLTGNEETYTLMGPWESDPSRNVISYQSPFGNELVNHKVGDELKFTINERDYSFNVIDLKKSALLD
jgi:transcription elongation factor GreA